MKSEDEAVINIVDGYIDRVQSDTGKRPGKLLLDDDFYSDVLGLPSELVSIDMHAENAPPKYRGIPFYIKFREK